MARMRSSMEMSEVGTSEVNEISDRIKEEIENLKDKNQLARDRIKSLKSKNEHYRVLFFVCLLIICVSVGRYFGSQSAKELQAIQVQKLRVLERNWDELKRQVDKEKEEQRVNIDEIRENQVNETRRVEEGTRDIVKNLYLLQALKVQQLEENIAKLERQTRKEKEQLQENIDNIHEKQMSKLDNVEERLREIDKNEAIQNWGEFVWPIDGWAAKVQSARDGSNEWLFSEPFYSHKNGYKMCLSVWPNGIGDGKGTHLSVYFHLLRSPFNNILAWPFKRPVTFSVINQQTGINHASHQALYEHSPNHPNWNKPTTDIARGLGTSKLISLAELSTNAELCRDDRIFIRCVVE